MTSMCRVHWFVCGLAKQGGKSKSLGNRALLDHHKTVAAKKIILLLQSKSRGDLLARSINVQQFASSKNIQLCRKHFVLTRQQVNSALHTNLATVLLVYNCSHLTVLVHPLPFSRRVRRISGSTYLFAGTVPRVALISGSGSSCGGVLGEIQVFRVQLFRKRLRQVHGH